MTVDPVARAMSPADTPPLDARALYLRRLVIDALAGGGRGHVGSSLSLIEIVSTLYDAVMAHRPDDPWWADRDRFILSKGHGCLAQYAVLADHGYFPLDALKTFCRAGSILGGHPERGHCPGVEASTGALGHGLSIGLGMALAARIRGAAWRVFVAMGDGEINEGSVWEAAMCAGKHGLERLIAVIDYNKIQSAGPTKEIQDLEPLADKWRAFGWGVAEVDGHDKAALERALQGAPFEAGKPSCLIAHTVKGKGVPFAEHDPTWHHKSKLPDDEIHALYEALGGAAG